MALSTDAHSGEHVPGILRLTVLTDPSGIAVEGDVDVRTFETFNRAVVAAVEASPGDVHIDLTRLGFIDLDGLRVLVAASSTLSQRGSTLRLHGMPAHLRDVLRIVGWAETLGVSRNPDAT